MKVFIEEKDNGKFLGTKGKWTKDWTKARDFKQTRPALRHCMRYKRRKLCLVVVFEEGKGGEMRLEAVELRALGTR